MLGECVPPFGLRKYSGTAAGVLFSSVRSAMDGFDRKLDRLREIFNIEGSKFLSHLSCPLSESPSLDSFLSSPPGPFKLLLPPELDDAILAALDGREGPGSEVMIPNAERSPSSRESGEVKDSLEGFGLGGKESRPKLDLDRGDRGERGEDGAGAGAMRTTGGIAASSGCKSASCVASDGDL
jgi:hypothetical protein